MRHLRRIACPLLTVLLVGVATQTTTAADINSGAGTTAFPFLKINVSARAVAMGSAFTGLADDESSLYYNPAGIASLEQNRFILGYHNYFVDMQSGFAGYVHEVDATKTVGIFASYLNYGDFTETDVDGNVTGEFGGGDFLMGVSAAIKRGMNLSFGATAKFIYEKIQDYSATGFAVDLGLKYTADRNRYSGGVMVQNLGAQLSALGEEKDKLPLIIRGGVAVHPRGLPLMLAADVVVPNDNDPFFAIGGEYFALKPLFIRLGWNSFGSNFRAAESDDKWAGFSAGVGIDVVKKLQLSYAFSPAADLGESHRVTLTGGL